MRHTERWQEHEHTTLAEGETMIDDRLVVVDEKPIVGFTQAEPLAEDCNLFVSHYGVECPCGEGDG